MQMQGERSIKASRAEVWRALNDAEVLKSCISGCDEMEKTSGTTFEASVVQKVGPMKARFRGSVELSDIVKEKSYTITGEGKGGAAGFAKGLAKVQLTDSDAETLLTYEVEAKVGGKLAQLGSRLIAGFARKMTDEFFNKFQQAVEGPPEKDDSDTQAPEEKKKGWFRRVIG
jgi:carbon monoxide dehydrogenase subunit G